MIWFIVSIIVILLNIPFGYWRENVKKFSLPWFLSVHLPVPIIIFLRLYFGLGWALFTFPILIGSYFAGQLLGARLHILWSKTMRVTGCLFYDIIRTRWVIIISR
ncbi:hypothetical protein Desaci_2258 [Desulfosporosinus acidiphilus SJ4]|uniref:Uncharacterized protein n=2 Tax=Desulfosporosinus TaxID=79206 RepID=I4D5Z3_DESAJ|nr:hypothetical protein Desaci_2258 [Desulfosporosinus acidiphilus SJ4]